jgi:hypothetical protein
MIFRHFTRFSTIPFLFIFFHPHLRENKCASLPTYGYSLIEKKTSKKTENKGAVFQHDDKMPASVGLVLVSGAGDNGAVYGGGKNEKNFVCRIDSGIDGCPGVRPGYQTAA